jgi:hypothetical protein
MKRKIKIVKNVVVQQKSNLFQWRTQISLTNIATGQALLFRGDICCNREGEYFASSIQSHYP